MADTLYAEFLRRADLRNANIIIGTANKQFLNGEINYLEWMLLMKE